MELNSGNPYKDYASTTRCTHLWPHMLQQLLLYSDTRGAGRYNTVVRWHHYSTTVDSKGEHRAYLIVRGASATSQIFGTLCVHNVVPALHFLLGTQETADRQGAIFPSLWC